jgi:hypothetical protein
MSTLFYDHLFPCEKVEITLSKLSLSSGERIEIIEIVEETIHTKTLHIILEHLPQEHHEGFLHRFHRSPHDETHLIFLRQHAHPEIEGYIREELEKSLSPLLEELLFEVISA